MNVSDMIDEVARRLPGADAPPAADPRTTRHRIEAEVTTELGVHRVAIEAFHDAKGQRRERYWCDGFRLQRHELLRLTCPETECPQSTALRGQWRAFLRRQGRAGGGVQRSAAAGQPPTQPLVTEHPLRVAGRDCVARPAIFRCFTACPHRAHPPMWLDKRGLDVFEEGVCIGGGLAPGATVGGTATLTPRLPDLRAAESYVLARTLEVRAVLAPLSEAP